MIFNLLVEKHKKDCVFSMFSGFETNPTPPQLLANWAEIQNTLKTHSLLRPIHIPCSVLIQNWWKSSLSLSSPPVHVPYQLLIQNWWKTSIEPPSSSSAYFLFNSYSNLMNKSLNYVYTYNIKLHATYTCNIYMQYRLHMIWNLRGSQQYKHPISPHGHISAQWCDLARPAMGIPRIYIYIYIYPSCKARPHGASHRFCSASVRGIRNWCAPHPLPTPESLPDKVVNCWWKKTISCISMTGQRV